MTRVDTPQTRCRAAFAQADITPPNGIYHRMWGAALHEVATGVHRPLMATAMLVEARSTSITATTLPLTSCGLTSAGVKKTSSRIRGRPS